MGRVNNGERLLAEKCGAARETRFAGDEQFSSDSNETFALVRSESAFEVLRSRM